MGVDDVKRMLGAEAAAGVVARADEGEGIARAGIPDDADSLGGGVFGGVRRVPCDEKGDLMPSGDQSSRQLTRDDAGAAGQVFKHGIR